MILIEYPQPILAIFNNGTDEEAFNPLLAGFPGLTTVTSPPGNELFAERMATLGLTPALVIISSRLYPEKRADLVAALKEIYPTAEILLATLASDPLPPLEQLAADRVRHLLVTPTDTDRSGIASLQEAIIKLLAKHPWKIFDYVNPGTRIHEVRLSSSAAKEPLIAMLENVLNGDSADRETLRQRATLLADEMVENALYGAPRDHYGRKLYTKGDFRFLEDTEKIVFRFAFDGETLAMEIADGWGTLEPEMVLDHLARNQEGFAGESVDVGGCGLCIIWRFLDHFHVNIRP